MKKHIENQIFIGIDGGATYIRVLVAGSCGNILSHIKYEGGAAIQKNAAPQMNMRNAITFALEKANIFPEDITAIGAGISGYDDDDDLVWVNLLIDIDGLDCPIKYVNDAEIAHIGAFGAKGGIIAICGTGSIVFGMNESGKKIRNYDFDDYAYSASRHLTQNFINRAFENQNDDTDEQLLKELLKHFGVSNVDELSVFASDGKELKNSSDPRQFGVFAKFITEYASKGSRLAQIVCEDSANEVCNSVEQVSKRFEKPLNDIALIGSVANSKYIFDYIDNTLSAKGYNVKHNVPLPEIGGVLLAMQLCSIVADERTLSNLCKLSQEG